MGIIRRIKNKVLNEMIEYRKQAPRRQFTELVKSGVVSMGQYSYGYPNIQWDRHSDTTITIGKFCSIAENVNIFNGSNHNINWISTYPMRIMLDLEGKFEDGHPTTKGDVIIGNDVWIGWGATIYSGCKIGDGAVIAGCAVVSKDVEPYSIVAGNPAKSIKKRFSDEDIERLIRLKWWDWDVEKIKKNIPLLCSEEIEEFLENNDS